MAKQRSEIDQVDGVVSDWAAERPDLRTRSLGSVLRLQLLAKVFSEQLTEELANLDLEWWEYDVLSVLRRRGKPYRSGATEIADKTRLSPGAMTNRIDRLQDKGLVTRIVDESDRRKVIVQLSRRGKSLIDRATVARFSCADSALKGLGKSQRVALDEALRGLVRSNKIGDTKRHGGG